MGLKRGGPIETTRSKQELESLHDLSLKLASSRTLKEALRIILLETLNHVQAPAGSIALYDRERKEMLLFTYKGFSRAFGRTRRWKIRKGGLTEYVFRSREPVVVDIERHNGFNNPIILKEGIKSVVGVPLYSGRRKLGILYVNDFRKRKFSRKTLHFLSLLAYEVSLLIEKFALIEELKKQKEELERAKDYLKNIIHDSPDVIITTNRKGRIIEFNPAGEKILGYRRQEVLGRDASELYMEPEERKEILKRLEKDRNILNYETTLKRKDGRPVEVSLSISNLHDGEGNIVGTVGISKDITEEKHLRKALEERNRELEELNRNLERKVLERTAELERANRELERSNRYKSEFIANMSHELRTPLNSIIGFSELLLERLAGPLNERQEGYINNILNSGRHLLAIINNVLDMAKIETGRINLDIETFDPAQAVKEVEGILRPLFEKKGVTLEIKADEGKDLLIADRIKFKQILYNLLSNGLKFTERGGKVELTMEVTSERALPVRIGEGGKVLLVRVRDTGIGIKKEDMERIFKDFEQVDKGLSRRYGGTGLGLSIAKRFIEMHGGAIWVDSIYGQGSTFSFALPSQHMEPPPVGMGVLKDQESLHLEEEPLRKDPPLILVAEDDRATSELLTLYLLQGGYRVAHAHDGEEAIKKAVDLQPFCILLDIMLPKKDGWEVLQELKEREETKDIPVIINSIIDNKELGFALGAVDYFIKPLDRKELLDRLGKIDLARKRYGHTTVIIMDRDESSLETVRDTLEGEGIRAFTALTGREGLSLAGEIRPDLIILNLTLPDMDGMEVIRRLKSTPSLKEIPIFAMSERDLTREEKLKLLGRIENIFQKGRMKRGDLIEEVRQVELLYPQKAGLIDGLTGTFNAPYLSIRLSQEIKRAERCNEPISIVVFDMDSYSLYLQRNDRRKATTLLRKVAEVIGNAIRGYDTLIRTRRDEFTVILPYTLKSEALRTAERLRRLIEEYPFIGEENLPGGKVTASFGVVTYPVDGRKEEDLMEKARMALKKAKKTRNRVVSWEDREEGGDGQEGPHS